MTCIGSLEFFDQPEQAVREMQRVLRPGGRAVPTVGWRTDDGKPSGEDALWLWTWNEADVRRMMTQAGFSDVTISYGPWGGQEARLVRGIKATWRAFRASRGTCDKGRQPPRAGAARRDGSPSAGEAPPGSD